MNKIVLEDKEFDIIIEENVKNKLEVLGKTSGDIVEIIKRNDYQIFSVDLDDEFIIDGDITIIGIRKYNEIIVTTIIGQKNIF